MLARSLLCQKMFADSPGAKFVWAIWKTQSWAWNRVPLRRLIEQFVFPMFQSAWALKFEKFREGRGLNEFKAISEISFALFLVTFKPFLPVTQVYDFLTAYLLLQAVHANIQNGAVCFHSNTDLKGILCRIFSKQTNKKRASCNKPYMNKLLLFVSMISSYFVSTYWFLGFTNVFLFLLC